MSSASTAFKVHYNQKLGGGPIRPSWGGECTMASGGDRRPWFSVTIDNQSQLSERKHMARYWSIAAVPLSAHPSPLVITTKLAAAIYGGAL